ncbi:MAG TPA: hypothetical protein ENK72_02175, partial [Epsilonproteobacteria bacterium]|nr:hypothetical protein [Campylobacterota bacterium]
MRKDDSKIMKLFLSLIVLSMFTVELLATPVYEESTTAVSGSNVQTLTLDVPGGTAENDLLIAAISTDGSETFNTTTGWTLFGQQKNSGSTLAVFYRVADGNESSDYSFTWNSNEQAAGAMLRYSAINPADPFDVSSFDTGNSNKPTAPSVTTTEGYTRIVRVFGADDDDTPITSPSGHVERIDLESNSGGGTTTLGVADVNQTSTGSTGSAIFDLAGGGNERWVALTMALNADPTDTDSDGIPDFADIDDDNDGIIDTVETESILNIYNQSFEEPAFAGTN